MFESDENFYFIAGYTDGGFPYGITWEEHEAEQRGEQLKEDKKLQSTLMHILSGGKRIFRRFKDVLSSDNQQLERYYLFIDERNRMRIEDWLESIDVKFIVK